MLSSIERATKKSIEKMSIPSASDINEIRVDQFKANILERLENQNLTIFQDIIENLIEENQADPIKIASALAHMCNGSKPFLLDPQSDRKINRPEREERSSDSRRDRGDRGERGERGRRERKRPASNEMRPLKNHPEVKLTRYRVDVGHNDGVKPGNIVGAIANTADLDSEYIGQIEIYDGHSTVDLPAGMPDSLLTLLQNAKVSNRPMGLKPETEGASSAPSDQQRKPRKRKDNSSGDRKPRARKMD
jgi:ATP-dependent RNA helicase DeaD